MEKKSKVCCLLKTFFGIVFGVVLTTSTEKKVVCVLLFFFDVVVGFVLTPRVVMLTLLLFFASHFSSGVASLESSCSGEWCDVDRFDRWGRSTTITATIIIGHNLQWM